MARELQQWSQKMCKPSFETLPWCAEIFPFFRSQYETVIFFVIEKIVKFLSRFSVYDDCVLLIVPAKAPRI